jgi:hypothetical protein
MLNDLAMNRPYRNGYSLFVLKGVGKGITGIKLTRGASLKYAYTKTQV